ncbi:hypothetical protein [Arthrobacter sp.]|uniref:hypothetical protein n=1 Tax=Arthrobacter sp. TaxID=1667 RepID=UPI00339644D9
MTPKGPRRCSPGLFRTCPIEEHYASPELVVSGERIRHENIAHLAEVKRLHDNHRNPDPKIFSRSAFSFSAGSSSPRKFGQEMDARIDSFGVKPQIYHSMGTFRMANGNGMEVNAQVMRTTEVNEGFACYDGVWRIIIKANKVGLHRHAKTVREESLDLSTAAAVKATMPKAFEIFRTAAISSGIYNEERANQEATDMLAHFKVMFNAVETEADDVYDVYDRGMGYFAESDNSTIVVNENYRSSAFRAVNFKDFLAANLVYGAHQPDAEIRVADRHDNTGASWTLKKENGQWAVEKVYDDGRSEVVNISTAQEALDHVYYHVLAQINPDNEEKALEKGRYAAELVHGVEAALEANKAVIDEHWRTTSRLTERDRH